MRVRCQPPGSEHGHEYGRDWCGVWYDDAEQSTLCPHDPLPPKLTEEQLRELYDHIEGTGIPPKRPERRRAV